MFNFSPSNLSIFSGLMGTLSSGIGSFYNAQVQKSQYDTAAIFADTNARIAELGAQSALNQGQREIGNLTLKAGQLKSSQRAALAANGVDLGQGNAAELQTSTDLMKEIDTNTLQANAVRTAWGYRTQAVNYKNQALGDRAASSMISPLMEAGSTLLSGASRVASNWYMLNKLGAFDSNTGGTASAGSLGAIGNSGWADQNSFGFNGGKGWGK